MNELKMDLQQSIRVLTQQGWSQRKIARELGIDRETVARHRRLTLEGAVSNPAIPPPGSAPPPSMTRPLNWAGPRQSGDGVGEPLWVYKAFSIGSAWPDKDHAEGQTVEPIVRTP